ERTLADTPASLRAVFDVSVAGARMQLERPVAYAWVDRVLGERMHPVEVLPSVTATFGQRTRMVRAGTTVHATLTLRAEAGAAAGTLRLTAPEGGSVQPSELSFQLGGDAPSVQVVELELTAGAEAGALRAEV